MNCKARAVIIGGGEIRDYGYIKTLITDSDYVICADSGYNHAVRMGAGVDLLIGDFDSLEGGADGCFAREVVTYPAEKDSTDTELALAAARERGFADVMFLACTGSRIDHTLANILLLRLCAENGVDACIVNENNTVRLIVKEINIKLKKGQTVSLVPVSDCYGVTVRNLKYPLNVAELPLGSTRGISNVAVAENVYVSVRRGLLLVILAND
jgi:thiamine pyrophosphokinase